MKEILLTSMGLLLGLVVNFMVSLLFKLLVSALALNSILYLFSQNAHSPLISLIKCFSDFCILSYFNSEFT